MNVPDHGAHFAKLLKSCATFLARWKGADAVMWELTSSHRTLRLVLTEAGRAGNLVLSCIDPLSIRGPVRWTSSDLSVTRIRLPAVDEDGYLIADANAELEVMCGSIEVAENVRRYLF